MDDNHIVTMLPEDDVCHHHIQQLDLDLAQKISNSSMSDPIITKALAAMNNADIDPWLPWTTKEDWKFEDSKLYFKHPLYIPGEARHQLVTGVHEFPAGGHSGFFWTLHLLQEDYWWPGMSTFLQQFIMDCTACQSAKANTHSIVPGLTPLVVKLFILFSSILVDLISGLPLSHSFDSVMVMVNLGLMKEVIYCPCTKEIIADAWLWTPC